RRLLRRNVRRLRRNVRRLLRRVVDLLLTVRINSLGVKLRDRRDGINPGRDTHTNTTEAKTTRATTPHPKRCSNRSRLREVLVVAVAIAVELTVAVIFFVVRINV